MSAQTIIPPSSKPRPIEPSRRYGRFMDRLMAFALDFVIATVILMVVYLPFLFFMGLFLSLMPVSLHGVLYLSAYNTVALIVWWLYFAGMESKGGGATFGKRAMNLRVVNANDGRQLTFAQASLRFGFKLVSIYLIGLGCLMALFTEKRQALHDFAAQTVVVDVE